MLEAESLALMHDIIPRHTPTPDMSPGEARAMALALGRLLQGEPVPMEVEDWALTTASGHAIPVRLYRPSGTTGGWLLWIHGGGFTTGGLDTHDTLCRRLAHLSGQTVISVDYRLAPEHRYPAALDDCETTLDWLCSEAEGLGLDMDRAAIGGSSAGGNLAAALVLRHRDKGGPRLRRQILVYPCVDATMASDSFVRHATGYQLTSAMMAQYLEYYCGTADRRDPFLSPLFAPSLADLPPAEVILAELDPLVDEGAAYARRLQEAGVLTRTTLVNGVMHGFFAQAGALTKARAAQELACQALRQEFG